MLKNQLSSSIAYWKQQYNWKCLQLEKAEELLEKYSNQIKNNSVVSSLKFIKMHKDAELPRRAHASDAGLDCKATSRVFLDKFNNPINEDDSLEMRNAVKVQYGLGFGCEVPYGYALKPHPRSGIFKTGLLMANSVGVGDSGYMGEYKATFYLLPFSKPYEVGDSICQLLLEKVEMPEAYWGDFNDISERGEGGHNSTGNIFNRG